MSRTIKRMTAVLLSVILMTTIFTALPFTANAAGSGTTGDCTWELDSSGTLTISGNGNMANYTFSYSGGDYHTTAPWGWNVKKVVIEKGVKKIGQCAFYGCESLTEAKISDSVTVIDYGAFLWCHLSSVTIPHSVESVGLKAFYGCEYLTDLTIESGVVSIDESAFFNCKRLLSVTIPESVTDIGDQAFGCMKKNYSYVSVDGFTIYGVKGSAANVYADNYNFTFVNIGKRTGTTGDCTWTMDDNDVLTISGNGSMADYEEHSMAPWDTNVKKVVIKEGVVHIGKNSFNHSENLTTVTIPDSVKTIGDYAFYYCKALKDITIPDGITYADSTVFSNTKWYNDLPDGAVYVGRVLYDYKGEKDTCPKTVDVKQGTMRINDEVFKGCKNLETVTLPDTLLSIGYSAFSYSRLNSINIPDSVTDIGSYAFYSCSILDDISISNSITSISDGMFGKCGWLNSVSIPNGVTSIGDSAFSGCTDLTDITIPDSVTSIGKSAFYKCESLTEITIPKNVTSIEVETFCICPSLTKIVIPESVTSFGNDAFYGCDDLTIYGYSNTPAQYYANENDIPFIPLSDEPTEPTTVEPTTAEPTTVEPTTAEPTTEPIIKVIIGDINNDGVVNGADAGLLSRYTSGWKGYESKIKNMAAADINGDGNVNGADSGILARYTSGWKQYDKYFS